MQSSHFSIEYQLRETIAVAALLVASALGATLRAQTTNPFSAPPVPSVPGVSVPGVMIPPQQAKLLQQPAPAQPNPTPASPSQEPITPTGAQPLEGGQIVARVDGQIVLASDVLWQVDQLIAANRDRIPPDKLGEARNALLRQQVMGTLDTKMLYANFRRTVPAENLPMIEENLRQPFEDQEIPRLIKMLKLNNRAELDALLRKSGTSIDDVRRQFMERTIAGEWLRQMVPKPEEATHEEMLQYYNDYKKDFSFPSQVKWEELMIRFDRVGGDRTKAWRAITGLGNDVWQRVSRQPGLRGPVFTEIAPQKSHGFTASKGGQHEWTTKGALRSEEINEALFSLQVGQLSNVIETDQGFHIIRVLDRKEAGCTPFTEAQARIREKLESDQKKGLAQTEVAKLRKSSRIWTLFDGDLKGDFNSTAQLGQKPDETARR